jgi:adenine-specific DNA-methyltransferase
MTKLNLQTPDFVAANAARLAELFPNCVTETRDPQTGAIKRVIDFDLLRQELAYDIVEGPQERYRLDWPGKREALALANAPIRKTLRPCKEESVDFDDTENLYIEGDNLDALKLLQETYLGKVKMIYIDPPYNTGNDFIYDDNFSISREEYQESSGAVDEEGNAMFDEEKWRQNSSANGRFHSEWLSMIYPRIKLSRNMLCDDGVFIASIGGDEVKNLVSVCDEVFGVQNRIAVAGRLMKKGGNKGDFFSPNLEYFLVYAKNIELTKGFRKPMDPELIRKVYTKTQTDGDRKGERYRAMGLYQSSLDPMRGCRNQRYFIEAPDGELLIPPGEIFPKNQKEGESIPPQSPSDKVWRWTYPKFLEEKKKGNVEFAKSNNNTLMNSEGEYAKWNINTKIWLADRDAEGQLPADFIGEFENRHSAKELIELGIDFDFAKPSEFIKYLLTIVRTKGDDIVLDFFSGSATTAHAVIQLNAEDGERRRYIQIQLPEPCADKSAARKAGFENIADVGKERIRRAGAKIRKDLESELEGKLPSSEEHDSIKQSLNQLDIGFRVLKIDSSNMADVYYQPDELTQDGLMLQVDNLKPGRNSEDLLFQVLLDWGVDLALPITEEKILKRRVFFVAENALAACFDTGLDEAFVKELAKRQPLRAVFRDSGYASDAVKINFEQIFKALSPHTELKTL